MAFKACIECWQCNECDYRVTDLEYNLIKFEPICRCGDKWGNFIPRLMNENARNVLANKYSNH